MSLFERIGGPGITGPNFTERTRRVLDLARDEANRLHHEYVGTEHLLLGLISEGHGVATACLENLGVDPQQIRRTIEETVKVRNEPTPARSDLPYTTRSKKVLDLSLQEARTLHHSYVGTEHLLLGMLAERMGIAAQVLADSGVTLEIARPEIHRLLGAERSARPNDEPPNG